MDDVFVLYQQALRTGHQLAAEGRFKDALASYEQAAKVAAERALPHVCVGSMRLHLGRRRTRSSPLIERLCSSRTIWMP